MIVSWAEMRDNVGQQRLGRPDGAIRSTGARSPFMRLLSYRLLHDRLTQGFEMSSSH